MVSLWLNVYGVSPLLSRWSCQGEGEGCGIWVRTKQVLDSKFSFPFSKSHNLPLTLRSKSSCHTQIMNSPGTTQSFPIGEKEISVNVTMAFANCGRITQTLLHLGTSDWVRLPSHSLKGALFVLQRVMLPPPSYCCCSFLHRRDVWLFLPHM